MFEVGRFIEDCKEASREDDTRGAVRGVVERAVAHPDDVLRGLGEPTRAGVDTIYQGEDLTILNVLWGPRMTMYPHNHLMWAIIGIYGGQEDNTFYKRATDGLEITSAKRLVTGGRRAVGGACHPLGAQPVGQDHGGHPRLRRRLLQYAAQRVEP